MFWGVRFSYTLARLDFEMRYVLASVLGLIAGSFANVCILRLPMDESLIFPPSHCPRCGQPLKAIHNVPVFSYLALRGHCAFCHVRISLQYPLIEALMAFVFIFHAWYFSEPLRLALADILGFYLICISLIDYRHRIIPDELSLSLAAIGLAFSFVNPYLSGSLWIKFIQSLVSGLGGGILMFLLAYAGEKAFKKEALGGGDVKLIAASGCVLGWIGIAGPLFVGSLAGGLTAIILLIARKKRMGETLPFGPFLALGIYLTCLFPYGWTFLIYPQ